MTYESSLTLDSTTTPGVSLVINKPSFARRVELTRRIRELANRVEFLSAGTDAKEKLDSALASAEIDRIYVEWGVREVIGLEVDGAPGTTQSLIDTAPEALFREAVEAVKAELGLRDEERKN